MQSAVRAGLAGLAGASALTLVHQVARLITSKAPRMDVLGVRGLKRLARGADVPEPEGAAAKAAAFAGDIVSNSAYYSIVAARQRGAWARGALLGTAAGIGALALPPRLGLGEPPHSESLANKAMTVAWYLTGGLVAAAVANALNRE